MECNSVVRDHRHCHGSKQASLIHEVSPAPSTTLFIVNSLAHMHEQMIRRSYIKDTYQKHVASLQNEEPGTFTSTGCLQYDTEYLTIVTGATKLSDGGDVYKVSKGIYHERWDSNRIENDIAVLKTDRDIQLGGKVETIPLMTQELVKCGCKRRMRKPKCGRRGKRERTQESKKQLIFHRTTYYLLNNTPTLFADVNYRMHTATVPQLVLLVPDLKPR
ncbi:uncharacterized protein CBL_03177 [Carabus blaptoides fortunei]